MVGGRFEQKEKRNVGNNVMAPISVTVFTGFLGIYARAELSKNAIILICLCRRCWKNELDSQVPSPITSRLQGRFVEKRIR